MPLTVNLKNFNKSWNCSPLFEIISATLLLCVVMSGLCGIGMCSKSLLVQIRTIQMSFYLFTTTSVFSVPYYLGYHLLGGKNMECLPEIVRVSNEAIFRLLFFCGIGLGFGVFKKYRERIKKRRELELLSLECEELYSRILDPSFDMDAFIDSHKDFVFKAGFMRSDWEALKETCTQSTEENSSAEASIDSSLDQDRLLNQETRECVICYEDINSSYIKLPGCIHTYHIDCIEEWLKKSPTCPMCKCGTRLNLMLEIRRRVPVNQVNRKVSNTISVEL